MAGSSDDLFKRKKFSINARKCSECEHVSSEIGDFYEHQETHKTPSNLCPTCKGEMGYTDPNRGWVDCEACRGTGKLPTQEQANAIANLKYDAMKHNMTSRYLQKPDGSIKGLSPDGTEFELPVMLDYDDDDTLVDNKTDDSLEVWEKKFWVDVTKHLEDQELAMEKVEWLSLAAAIDDALDIKGLQALIQAERIKARNEGAYFALREHAGVYTDQITKGEIYRKLVRQLDKELAELDTPNKKEETE